MKICAVLQKVDSMCDVWRNNVTSPTNVNSSGKRHCLAATEQQQFQESVVYNACHVYQSYDSTICIFKAPCLWLLYNNHGSIKRLSGTAFTATIIANVHVTNK